MKRLILSMAVLLAASPALAQETVSPVSGRPEFDNAPWWMKHNVITQTGWAYLEVPANRARFTVSFLTVGDTAEKAQAKAIEQTRALNQVLSKFGKDAVRVTTSFSMRVLYDQYRDKSGNLIENERGDKIESYQVTLNINVEVRDMSVLEKAYASVLATNPTDVSDIGFSLLPSNEQNTWLNNEAIKDARTRATSAASASGATIVEIKLIDPTGRACNADILGPTSHSDGQNNDGQEQVVVSGVRKRLNSHQAIKKNTSDIEASDIGSMAYVEEQAMKNLFIQTPPLMRLQARSCVVYGLK